MTNRVAWTIGGSDSSCGAGIQADIITINNLGAHACSVITALTAQNTLSVNSIEPVSASILQAQIAALQSDLPPCSIKTGMLYNVETIKQVAKFFSQTKAFKICDPVMISTSGSSLLTGQDTVEAFIHFLLPHTDLLTPNIPEAETLLGLASHKSAEHSRSYIKKLANELRTLGAKRILLKGGHSSGQYCHDYFLDKDHSFWLSSKRIETSSTHGTGCTLSAAIAALIALNYSLSDALVIAKAYVNQGLRTAPSIGSGHGPIAHGAWPENFIDLPILIPDQDYEKSKTSWQDNQAFPDCGKEPLGIYPIVNDSSWLKKLLPLGINTVQLRIKNELNSIKNIEQEIAKAVKIAEHYSCRLFINDYWELAIKYGAYGIHLGQEDLDKADISVLIKSGIRLGISTHSYSEVARALSYKPSYIAIGPIYSTTTKNMSWAPQGLENLKRWRRSLPYPLVAIAGITLERLPDVIAAGADGVAVIRDILNDPDPLTKTSAWLKAYANARSLPPKSQVSH